MIFSNMGEEADILEKATRKDVKVQLTKEIYIMMEEQDLPRNIGMSLMSLLLISNLPDR
jgi:hypothetical protein